MHTSIVDYCFMKDGEDFSPAINKILHDVSGKVNQTVTFPKGVYHVYSKHCREKYLFISNHDQSLKRIALPISDRHDLTIDAHGSDFFSRENTAVYAGKKQEDYT